MRRSAAGNAGAPEAVLQGMPETTPQESLPSAPSFRRTVVLMVLIAILLFDWQPDAALLPTPERRREHDPYPLPDPGPGVPLRGARRNRGEISRPLPGGRQAARRRPLRRA